MNNYALVKRNLNGLNLSYVDDAAVAFLESGQTPSEWFDQAVKKLKSSSTRDAGLIVGTDNRTFFVKRFKLNKWQKLCRPLIKDRGLQAFNLSMDLTRTGISVPLPLAAVRDFKGSPEATYFISEALLHTQTLQNIIKHTDNPGVILNLMEYLASEIAKLHRAGFFHGDMKWKNIMLHPDTLNHSYFVDLDSSDRLKSSRDTRYARDLARFCVDIYELLDTQELIHDFLSAYIRHTSRTLEEVIEHIQPYHRKRAAKHKQRYGIDVPPIKLNLKK